MARRPARDSDRAAPTTATVRPPPPFSRAHELKTFLSTLDREKVYISHVDRHDAGFKKRIFAVPLAANALLVGLLAWRAYAALPTYWGLLLAALGNQTAYSVQRDAATWAQLARIAAGRAALFLADYLLVVGVGGWPRTFFCDRGTAGNPCAWRRAVGFRAREIYIRHSRGWGARELLADRAGPLLEDSPCFRTRVLPAIDAELLRRKTGYLLVDANWGLDFAAMVRAHRSVDGGRVAEELFEKSVWVFGGEEVGWCVWDVHRLHAHGDEAESRKKIVAFKDRLTAMGKESLFFRWIELIQYESSQPGESTPERQRDAVSKAKELFGQHGVDFERFLNDVGGLDGIPGLALDGQ